jgi:UDP-N-acetylglucosamine 3-dehydrogenase
MKKDKKQIKDRTQVLKVGLMSFAHMHAWSYACALKAMPEVEVVGIADDDKKRGKEMAKQLKLNLFKSYKDLLKSEVEAVVVCSENSKHLELVEMAAKAKKHILCEKPISTNIKDAQKMIQVCKDNQVKLQIAFPCRFATAVFRAKRMVENGEIGRILAIKATNHGRMPGGWFINKKLSGGGAVIDHTVHAVDLMRWFIRREVKKVYAEIDNLVYDIKIDDTGMLNLEFENGIFATLDTSWNRPKTFPVWGDLTMEIVGDKGVISVDAFAQGISVFDDKAGRYYASGWGSDSDSKLVKNFVDMALFNREPFITGYDGLKAMEVALAAYESAAKKKVIELPLK